MAIPKEFLGTIWEYPNPVWGCSCPLWVLVCGIGVVRLSKLAAEPENRTLY